MTRSLADRLAAIDWARVAAALDAQGAATLPALLTPTECAALRALYDDPAPFRRSIVIEQHAYGKGEYQYFRYPLPEAVAALRHGLYAGLAPIANRWQEALGLAGRFPPALDAYLAQCHAAGQQRPTPLLLKYEAGGFNCLHQDLYGALAFPLQLAILLSAPETEFSGGEFLLVERRPRAQSKGQVVPLAQGDAAVFAVRHRPAAGKRGFHRLELRHGVSPLRAGRRYTLGIIFHDAA